MKAQTDPMEPERLAFFLGGADLEMVEIARLLSECGAGARVYDRNVPWGTRASHYGEELNAALEAGLIPVLVELEDDAGLGERAIHIDHHGGRAGGVAATSLEQVFRLLGRPEASWSRWHGLVAANDRGWIPELRAAGASEEEIRAVRAADRKAQGITEAEERAALEAVRGAERLAGGELTVVRLPHRRTAPVTDAIELESGPALTNVLVLSHEPGETGLTEVNFSGEGRVVLALAERFPGGWYGGALPVRGFWGHGAPVPDGLVGSLVEIIGQEKGSL